MRLNGNDDKPLPAGREFPCKTVNTEVIHISNWLSRSQNFELLQNLLKLMEILYLKATTLLNWHLCYPKTTIITYKNSSSGITSTLNITAPIRMLKTRNVLLSNRLTVLLSFRVLVIILKFQ